MKRDDDFIRNIMMDLEESQDFRLAVQETLSSSAEEQKLIYHIQLLCDAGLFKQIARGVYRLSSQGHDYLDAVRDDTIWSKTKEGAATVGGLTIGMMKDLALAYVKQEAKERLGIEF